MSNIIAWKGMDELRAVLKKAVRQSPELVNQVIQNNAEDLQSAAKRYAPVAKKNGGFLRDNINVEYPRKLRADIKSGASYAGFQEYGTRFQPGTPHMRPAFADQIPELEKDIEDVAKGLFV